MKNVRTDFDLDINKILIKRFKLNISESTLKITERLLLDQKDIDEIKKSYISNMKLLHLKKIEAALECIIKESNKALTSINSRTIISIILEMLKPQKQINKKYITISEFSSKTGIKNSSIKNTLLIKKYLSSKFITIPTRTALCKEIVSVKQYKHFKDPDLDLIFYWKESFLFSILNEIKKDMKPPFKIFHYRKPKNIHEAFNSINYIIEKIINFKQRYKKSTIYDPQENSWVAANDYCFNNTDSMWLLIFPDKTKPESIIKHLEFLMIQNANHFDESLLEKFNSYNNIEGKLLNKSHLYIYDIGHRHLNSINYSYSLRYQYYMSEWSFFYKIRTYCEFLTLLDIDITTKESAINTINKYANYISKNKCPNNCIRCNKWINYHAYDSYISSTGIKNKVIFIHHINTNIEGLEYNYSYNKYESEWDFLNEL